MRVLGKGYDEPTPNPAGAFLIDHPIPSWIIGVFAFFAVTRAFGATAPLDEPTRLALAVLTICSMVAVPVATWAIRRKGPAPDPSAVFCLEWVLASTPLLLSYSALMDRSPPFAAPSSM